jgi:hypothetical protein
VSEPTIPLGDGGLPMMQGPPPILLPPDPADAVAALESALSAAEPFEPLREIAGRWPASVEAWARLGEAAYSHGQDVEAFAFFRTGYHRGLDSLRRHGWRGMGYLPWSHEPNRGVLRAFRGLMLASAVLGEAEEALRLRQLLLDSDPSDPLGVRRLSESDFQTRLRLGPI